VIVIVDGSSNGTSTILGIVHRPWMQANKLARNGGKANAVDIGLEHARIRLTITVDADPYLHRGALRHRVGRHLSDPPDARAVAGAVWERNSRANLATAAQERDCFHDIAAIKRPQGRHLGTLLAQGALSIHRTDTVRELSGFAHTIGADIVLTCNLLDRGHPVAHVHAAGPACAAQCGRLSLPCTLLQLRAADGGRHRRCA
jgi:biofilm PGA synthesis N-glycosyltransferase PgaC